MDCETLLAKAVKAKEVCFNYGSWPKIMKMFSDGLRPEFWFPFTVVENPDDLEKVCRNAMEHNSRYWAISICRVNGEYRGLLICSFRFKTDVVLAELANYFAGELTDSTHERILTFTVPAPSFWSVFKLPRYIE